MHLDEWCNTCRTRFGEESLECVTVERLAKAAKDTIARSGWDAWAAEDDNKSLKLEASWVPRFAVGNSVSFCLVCLPLVRHQFPFNVVYFPVAVAEPESNTRWITWVRLILLGDARCAYETRW